MDRWGGGQIWARVARADLGKIRSFSPVLEDDGGDHHNHSDDEDDSGGTI